MHTTAKWKNCINNRNILRKHKKYTYKHSYEFCYLNRYTGVWTARYVPTCILILHRYIFNLYSINLLFVYKYRNINECEF